MQTLAPPFPRSGLVVHGVAVLGVVALAFGMWLPGGGLALVYPAAACAVAAVLYAVSPTHYLGFAWWIWFITPLVRRVADFQTGAFDATNPIMLTPFLVAGLGVVTVLRYGAELRRPAYRPLHLAAAAVVLGALVGVARAGGRPGPTAAVAFDLLEWGAPLVLAAHVLALRKWAADHRRIVQATFVWGGLLMASYGVVQFVAPSPWDAQWLLESGMTGSIGFPEPFGLRAFSTLNAPGPFAMVLVAVLLVALGARGAPARMVTGGGAVALLLTLVRGAWVVALLGVLAAALASRGAARRRLVVVLALGAVLVVPLAAYAPLAERVVGRANTLTELREDSSFKARARLYAGAAGRVLTNPLGHGLGTLGGAAKLSGGSTVSLDSGVLALPAALGWLGGALYLSALVGALGAARRARRYAADPAVTALVAVAVAFLGAMVFANQVTGVKGAVLWTALALAMASGRSPDPDAS